MYQNAQNLISIRDQKGHTRSQAAKIIGVSAQTLKRVELWGRNPNSENLLKLSRYYGLSPEKLLNSIAK